MLNRILIKNVALIESAEITFTEGLNVLSGETGDRPVPVSGVFQTRRIL